MLSCPHMRFGRKLASQLLLHNPEEGRASPHPIRIEELVGKSRFLWKGLSEGCVPEASTLPCTQRIPPGSPSQPGIQCFCKPEEPPFESLREFISSFIPIVPASAILFYQLSCQGSLAPPHASVTKTDPFQCSQMTY